MKTSKMPVCFAIVLLMMVGPAHARKLCLQLNPEVVGAGASEYRLVEIPTGNSNFLLSGRSSTELPYPPFTVIEAVVTGGGGLLNELKFCTFSVSQLSTVGNAREIVAVT